ncbi:MAG: TonB-dependent receptor [Bacteroidales bacterium]|nr:TonB-dependent receptor [Bacteroidales bacterium]
MKNISLSDFLNKKNSEINFYLKVMKATAIFLFVFVFSLSAENANSQNAYVNLKTSNAPLESVLNAIENQTNYLFIYSVDVDVTRKVSINVKRRPVSEVLNFLLEGTNTIYSVEGSHIILSKNKSKLLRTIQQVGKKIGGKVVDSHGDPIIGANVIERGKSSSGTITDMNGNFSLDVSNNAILVISYVGYKSLEITVGKKSTLSIILSENNNELNEIVVVGYGSVKKSDLTGSVSTIKSTDFNAGNVSSPDMLMNGHIAGVQIVPGNGQPGANTYVRIRGVNSISASSDPLYVIDGVPVDNSRTSTNLGGDLALSNETLNPLSMINPSDIESMTVLKDASATAIYGSRGANGVIIIKTKGGKEGISSASYSGSVGFSNVSKKIDVLTADQYRTYVSNTGTASTNWQDAIFRTAFSQNHNVTFSNGNQKTSYRGSLSASEQQGVILNTGLNRYTARFNVTHKMFDDRLILAMNLNNTNYKFNNFVQQQTNGADGGIINNALKADPTQAIYNDDGSFKESSALSVRNPVAMAKQISDISKGDRFIGNAEATLFLLPKVLSFRANYAYDVDNTMRKAYQPIASMVAKTVNGRALVENNKYFNQLIETYLTYSKTFNQKHNLNIVGGYSWQEFDNYNSSTTATGFVNDNLGADNIGGATNQVTQNDHEINRLVSFYGRANYDYAGRYLFTATVRRDGSSRFGANNRWATFPSAAFAWRISEENFMKKVDFINDLKLRIGYGITGNQEIGNFKYSATYAINSSAGTYFGGTFYAPYNITGIANPNLKWEQTSQFNAGIDIALFNSKLRGTIDVYNKKTTNLLLSIDAIQPAVSSTYLENIGAMTNKGIEFSLDAAVINSRDFKWNSNFNISYNRNRITELYNNKDINYGVVSGAGASGNTQILRVGESFGSFYGQKFTGIVNGKETFKSDNKEILGKALPDYILGFTNSFSYKNFDLAFVLRSDLGASIYNNTRAEMSQGTRLPGQNTNIEGAEFYKAGGGGIVYPSSRWVENANFLRLDNMTLGYNFKFFPKSVKSARIYLTAQNLFVLSRYKGYDPEVNNEAGSNGIKSVGIDYCSYPHSRSFIFGLSVNF